MGVLKMSTMNRTYVLSLTLLVMCSASCRKEQNEVKLGGESDTYVAPAAVAAAPGTQPSAAQSPVVTAGTEFIASPNPASLIPGTNRGQTTLSWKTTGTAFVEIHVDKPDGPLFCKGKASGDCVTGNWVAEGQTFYLQNSSAAHPTDASATLATVTVNLR